MSSSLWAAAAPRPPAPGSGWACLGLRPRFLGCVRSGRQVLLRRKHLLGVCVWGGGGEVGVGREFAQASQA